MLENLANRDKKKDLKAYLNDYVDCQLDVTLLFPHTIFLMKDK